MQGLITQKKKTEAQQGKRKMKKKDLNKGREK